MTITPTKPVSVRKVSPTVEAVPNGTPFALKSTEETLMALCAPIDSRHFRTITKGKGDRAVSLSFIPWAVIAKCLHHRAPQWNWEVQDIKELAGCVVVTGRLSIPTTDGILHFSGVASEPVDGPSMAPAAESAASGALRRAAALAGLGLDLYLS